MLMILFITMKVKIVNKVLIWLGKVIFFIFTLQGIPQILFTKFVNNNYIIYILVILFTLLFAYLTNKFFMAVEQKLKNRSLRKDESKGNT